MLTSHINTAVFSLQVFFFASQGLQSFNTACKGSRKPYRFVDLAVRAMLRFALIFCGHLAYLLNSEDFSV